MKFMGFLAVGYLSFIFLVCKFFQPSDVYAVDSSGTWVQTGSLMSPRWGHALGLLQDGRVILAGGFDSQVSSSWVGSLTNRTELYNPITKTWSLTGDLNSSRVLWQSPHIITLNNGMLLVSNGENPNVTGLSSAELYNPTTGAWSFISNTNIGRYRNLLAILPNGKVLTAGGSSCGGCISKTAEIYDLTTNSWVFTGSMNRNRDGEPVSIILQDGRVLIAGGFNGSASENTAEIYNIDTGAWTLSTMPHRMEGGALTLLSNGKVLLAGGYNQSGPISSVAIYSPTTNIWSAVAPLSGNRRDHNASLLSDGNVIVFGGHNNSGQYTSTEIYNPSTNTWSPGPTLPSGVDRAKTIQLQNGDLLMAGGVLSNSAISSSTYLFTNSSSLDVPDIKQYSTPWNDDEYDTASKWKPVPKNTTVARWGCAMTSADMVLQYNGYTDVDPEGLNNWLKENDGYTRSGGILWNAVSKYTRDHKDDYSPALKTLEFAYHNVNDDNIVAEINDNKRPAIFKMENNTTQATHFIVGKGVREKNNPGDDQDYDVNDPDSGTNETLSDSQEDFGMELVRYGIFTPSNTDLSYIVLLVDENVNLKVFNPNGTEVTDGYFKEGPIIDGEDKTDVSGDGKTLNALYLPKPVSGEYKVEVTGNGDYQLDSYLYDIEGNVVTDSHLDSVGTSSKDVFLIGFNHDISSNSHINEVTFQFLLNRLQIDSTSGLITHNGAYMSMRNMLENAQINYQKGNYVLSKQFLNSAIQKVQYYASIGGINQAESLLLVHYIQILAETF